ncbi:hypothetical protein BDV97DRAFT_354140 [Delphinella strobiligena]|nr:hypothetical protein BDV97DRAFT_354140 [Delphinella strobiligena]
MPPKRDITDFLRPFVRAKRKRTEKILDTIVVADNRTPVSSRPSTVPRTEPVQKSDEAILKPISPRRASGNVSKHVVEAARDPQALSFSSVLTSLSSGPSTPPLEYDEPQRRVRQMSILSIDSDKSNSPPPPPRDAVSSPPPTHERPADLSTSFATTSTHSAPPISSQSSSRRVVRDGQMAVTNSDSDSMDQDDDEMDEIEEMIKRKRLRMTLPPHVPETPRPLSPGQPSEMRELRSLRKDNKHGSSKSRKPAPSPQKKYKFSLADIGTMHKTETEWGEKKKEYERQSPQEMEDEKGPETNSEGRHKASLDQIADQLEGERGDTQAKTGIVRAMQRMDALEEEVHCHFFQPNHLRPSRPEFPLNALKKNKQWTAVMKDQTSRDHAFTSGFVADMTQILLLPDEIIAWLLQGLLYETQPQLSLACVYALETHFKKKPTSLEPLRETFLHNAGWTNHTPALEIKGSVFTEHHNPSDKSSALSATRWCSILVGKIGKILPPAEQQSWLHLLMLVLLDRDVQENVTVKSEVQTSLTALIDAIPTAKFDATVRNLGLSVIGNVNNAIVLNRLLQSLPSTIPQMHSLKRRIALSYIMKSHGYLTDHVYRLSITSDVVARIRTNKNFKIREHTDFAAMGARIAILDMATGAGFSDFGFLPEESEDKADTPVMGAGLARRPPPSGDEIAFNDAIDSLASELRALASNIRDAGAAHMQRTECKSMIEKLAYRLDYAARTRPKPKRSAFEVKGASGIMNGFVQRLEQMQQDGGPSSDDGLSST